MSWCACSRIQVPQDAGRGLSQAQEGGWNTERMPTWHLSGNRQAHDRPAVSSLAYQLIEKVEVHNHV